MILLAPFSLHSADSPVEAGAKPKNEGAIGAGEGPAWNRAGDLYFSGGNRITRRDSAGEVHIFREPSGGSNGLLFDAKGRLVTCEGRNRRVTRTEADGSITVLADRFEGHRFNSPMTSPSIPKAASTSPTRATAAATTWRCGAKASIASTAPAR